MCFLLGEPNPLNRWKTTLRRQEALTLIPYPWKQKGFLPVPGRCSRRRLLSAHNHASQQQRPAGQPPREKMPQGKLFRGRAAPTDHVPPAGIRGSLPGTQSSSVTVETTEPTNRLSQATPLVVAATPPPGSFPTAWLRRRAQCKGRAEQEAFARNPAAEPVELYNTHGRSADGLENSLEPRVCSGDVSPGGVVFP